MGHVYGAIMFSSGLIDSILSGLIDSILSGVIDSILSGQYEYRLSILSMKMHSAICDAIYQKSLGLGLSPDTRAKYTTGQIVNLMSMDVMNISQPGPVHERYLVCRISSLSCFVPTMETTWTGFPCRCWIHASRHSNHNTHRPGNEERGSGVNVQ